jgi:molybdate transport system permease protein
MSGERILDALLLSLSIAAIATTVVGLFGSLVGRYLAQQRLGGHAARADVIDAISSLPLFLPPTVLGYYLTLLFGRSGPLGELLGRVGIEVTFTWIGAAIAGAIVAFPLMVRSARIAFSSIDPELERAAELDGASRRNRWRYVILPLARGGLTGGLMLSFGRAIGEFGATLMIAGNIPGRTQTLPLAIYEAFTLGHDESATMMALILTGVSVVVVFVGLRRS